MPYPTFDFTFGTLDMYAFPLSWCGGGGGGGGSKAPALRNAGGSQDFYDALRREVGGPKPSDLRNVFFERLLSGIKELDRRMSHGMFWHWNCDFVDL